MVTYITAQYRHVVVCSGLYPVRSQSLHGGYSSGCIESAMQPSFTEKSSRTTLHYVIRNDSARDLVLPPLIWCRYFHLLNDYIGYVFTTQSWYRMSVNMMLFTGSIVQ